MTDTKLRPVTARSNVEFLRTYGRMGRIGLVGGTAAIDRGIRFAQRRLCADRKPSLWSHAFVFQGARVDGEPWLIESDIDISSGQVRNGVQEHRIEKYGDDGGYPNLAVLDFGLSEEQSRKLVTAALDFVSRSTRYAMGGVLRTYWAILRKRLDRERRKKDSVFCSAFVRALYQHIGLDLTPDVAVGHTTPEHLAQTPVAHTRYEFVREGG